MLVAEFGFGGVCCGDCSPWLDFVCLLCFPSSFLRDVDRSSGREMNLKGYCTSGTFGYERVLPLLKRKHGQVPLLKLRSSFYRAGYGRVA